jgi:hypothetical protein
MLPKSPKYTRFINEIILAEESDLLSDGRIMSHCQMYMHAMQEIGASTQNFENFLKAMKEHDFHSFEVKQFIPTPAYEFMTTTFSIVNSKSPHVVIAGFCYGRENIIPDLFLSILNKSKLSPKIAPIFREYLSKHIELDGDIHGPMAIEMTNYSCAGSHKKELEVESTKLLSIESRIRFWNGIHECIKIESINHSDSTLKSVHRDINS